MSRDAAQSPAPETKWPMTPQNINMNLGATEPHQTFIDKKLEKQIDAGKPP